jgi:predicted GIY-YIG superfamily endonuclease
MAKTFVYVLRSRSAPRRRYVGVTSDVRRRIDAHNAGLSPSTATYRPWELTVCIEFIDEHRAAVFERYLKTASGRAFAKRHFAVDGP